LSLRLLLFELAQAGTSHLQIHPFNPGAVRAANEFPSLLAVDVETAPAL
jgi:hypothetical protein